MAGAGEEDGDGGDEVEQGGFLGTGRAAKEPRAGGVDIEIGDKWFDEEFVIQGNSRGKVIDFFGNPRVRELIQKQPSIYFHVRDDEGWFGPQFPDGVDELWFSTVGVIKDVDRLKSLYELFAESLNQLCHIGSAYEDDPKLKFEN